MYITTISLSYIFLSISLIAFLFFSYFKFVLAKSSPKNKDSKKIIGNMKNLDIWKKKNNNLSYISLFWCILSLALFIYFKFYYTSSLLSIVYLFIYLAFVAITLFIGILGKNVAK